MPETTALFLIVFCLGCELPPEQEGPPPNPRNFSEFMAEGQAEEEAGRIEEALAAYESAAARYSLSPLAFHAVGRMRHRLRDFPGAIEAYKEAVRLVPDDASFLATIYIDLGEACLARSDFEQAAASFRVAIEKRPSDAGARTGLAEAYMGMGRSRLAREQLDQALTDSPNYAKGQHWMGRVEEFDRDYRRAEARYRKALLLNPNDPSLYPPLTKLLERQGRLDEAAALAARAEYLEKEKTYALPLVPGTGRSDPRYPPKGLKPPPALEERPIQ
ncbi:MAG: tetratricopeptide repeat protein [Planctomycetota bacterium]